ncbi:MAG: ATP-binding protein [Actinobacteria bacterium]|nr:ATP-binding protein [Actinomycetota bacterium]
MEKGQIAGLLLRVRGLAVLRGVTNSKAGQGFLALLDLLAQERPDPAAVAETFGWLWEELADEGEELLPDAWRSHLVGRLLEAVPMLKGVWVPWRDLEREAGAEASPRRTLAGKLTVAEDWGELVETLAGHYAVHGAGFFGRYRAFRWENGGLRMVTRPDPERLETLIGYEKEREPLLRNTERLLVGLPSHHALLYGLPGTGKSSTVKAVLNEYADRGLRLVELAREDLRELPRVLETLRGRGPRFILFVDDLSFEEHEVEYKALKALLEGSVEEPPENVRVYATSNRRNLIRERFSDRDEDGADDVHARDTMQEKLSLAARFGLRLTFPSPDQRRYLEIVSGLVRERGIEIPDEELEEKALLWDRWHAGRSGRTARQFVDELEAGLLLC